MKNITLFTAFLLSSLLSLPAFATLGSTVERCGKIANIRIYTRHSPVIKSHEYPGTVCIKDQTMTLIFPEKTVVAQKVVTDKVTTTNGFQFIETEIKMLELVQNGKTVALPANQQITLKIRIQNEIKTNLIKLILVDQLGREFTYAGF